MTLDTLPSSTRGAESCSLRQAEPTWAVVMLLRNLEMQSASQLIWINYGQNPTVSGIFCTWPHNGRKEPLIGNQTPLTDVIVVVARTARISKAICCSGAMFEGFDEDANCEVGLGRKRHFICGERSHLYILNRLLSGHLLELFTRAIIFVGK